MVFVIIGYLEPEFLDIQGINVYDFIAKLQGFIALLFIIIQARNYSTKQNYTSV